MATHVLVTNTAPLYALGLAEALAESGLTLESVSDALPRLSAIDLAAVLVGVHEECDLDTVIELTSEAPSAVVVTLVGHASAGLYGASLRAGASAAVALDAQPSEVVQTVAAALNQKTVLPTAIARELARSAPNGDQPAVSEAEVEWLRALAAGCTVAGLAQEACYSEREMHRRLRDLYDRMGAGSRSEAIVKAARSGLVE